MRVRIGEVQASSPEAQVVLEDWIQTVDLRQEMDLQGVYAQWGYTYDPAAPSQPGGDAVYRAVVIQAATEAMEDELEQHGLQAQIAVSGQSEC